MAAFFPCQPLPSGSFLMSSSIFLCFKVSTTSAKLPLRRSGVPRAVLDKDSPLCRPPSSAFWGEVDELCGANEDITLLPSTSWKTNTFLNSVNSYFKLVCSLFGWDIKIKSEMFCKSKWNKENSKKNILTLQANTRVSQRSTRERKTGRFSPLNWVQMIIQAYAAESILISFVYFSAFESLRFSYEC